MNNMKAQHTAFSNESFQLFYSRYANQVFYSAMPLEKNMLKYLN